MFTVPKPTRNAEWFQQRSFKIWLKNTFDLASRKRTYQLTMGSSDNLAWVAPNLRKWFVTTKLPEVSGDVRYDPLTPDERREWLLKGLACHEAGHVRFSWAKPKGHLGQVWNALEDERMERLMARQYPELERIFTFLGDTVTNHSIGKWTGSAMEGVLMWRFEHDRLYPRWRVRPEDEAIWNAEILPRIELAWQAPNSDVVTRYAQEIIDLLKDHQQQLNQQQSQSQPDQGQQGDEQQGEGQSGEGQSGEGQSGEGQSGGGQSGGGESDDEASEQKGGGKSGSNASGSDEEEEGTDQQGGGTGDDEESDEESSSGAGDQGENKQESGEGDQNDDDRAENEAERKARGDRENLGETEEPESWNGKVSATGADADTQDGEGGQREQDQQAAAASEKGDEQDQTSKAEDGKGGGKMAGKSSQLPRMPITDHADTDLVAEKVEGAARRLAPLLHPPEAPGRTLPSRSRGRFSYRRQVQGHERQFEQKVLPHKQKQIVLDLCIDVSSSMGEPEIGAARLAGQLLLRAASLGQSKAFITLFNNYPMPLVDRPMPYLEAARLVNGIQASGGTTLYSTLKLACEREIRHDEIHMITIICDGGLTASDYAACKQLVEEGKKKGKRFLPILIGSATQFTDMWRATFGSALPCKELKDMVESISTVLAATRQRHG